MDGFVVCDGKALSTEWKEVSDDGAVFLVPLSLRDTTFCGNDFRELAPEREPRDGRDMSKFGDVEWIDVGEVHDHVERNRGQVEGG